VHEMMLFEVGEALQDLNQILARELVAEAFAAGLHLVDSNIQKSASTCGDRVESQAGEGRTLLKRSPPQQKGVTM
jgi:hypothetical protein